MVSNNSNCKNILVFAAFDLRAETVFEEVAGQGLGGEGSWNLLTLNFFQIIIFYLPPLSRINCPIFATPCTTFTA